MASTYSDEPLNVKHYFDISQYANLSTLFGVKYVWEILGRISFVTSEITGQRILGTVEKGAIIKGPVFIGEKTKVESGAIVIGPSIIGNRCELRGRTYIRPNTIIADDCIINCEIKNSLILSNTKAIHQNSYIGDSLVGNRVNIACGTVTANLRFDRKSYMITINKNTYRMPTLKFGAVLGDDVQTGCNDVLAGSLIGRNTWIYPQIFLRSRYYPANSIMKSETNIVRKTKREIVSALEHY